MLRVTLFGSINKGSTDGKSFEPARDLPSLAGKVVLITGAAGDLGRQTAIELSRHGRPAKIYIADLPREESEKAGLIAHVIGEAYAGREDDPSTRSVIRFIDLDLTSFSSVRACVAEFLSKEDRLDILVLNAGVIRVPPLTTTEGYELHFGLNYLGHALLARLLIPIMRRTAQRIEKGEESSPVSPCGNQDVRIVVVSSEGHAVAPKEGIRYSSLKTSCSEMSYAQRYGQSKLALIGLMRGLTSRYPNIKSVAVHPGRILTGMAESLRKESLLARITTPIAPLICVPVTVGVRNHLWAATSNDIVSGMYYEPVGVPVRPSKAAQDEKLTDILWGWTSNELKGLDVV
ncbi:NAD(P)-binding protein [Nemania serpens]|nr:NAD(P)-binding protein [Nemania serpens]